MRGWIRARTHPCSMACWSFGYGACRSAPARVHGSADHSRRVETLKLPAIYSSVGRGDFRTPAGRFRRSADAAFFRGLRFVSGAVAFFAARFGLAGLGSAGPALGVALPAMSRPKIAERSSPAEKLAGGRSLLRQRSRLACVDDQFLLVHRAQAEEKLGLVIEPRADAVQHRRDMLAHAGPVRDNCTKAGSRPVKGTGRRSAGRSAP